MVSSHGSLLPESTGGEAALLRWQTAVHPHQLHPVPWFHLVHQVIVSDDVHGAGQLASGGLLRHLLDGEGLVVLVRTEAKLRLQEVVLLVLFREMSVFSRGPFIRRRDFGTVNTKYIYMCLEDPTF